MPLPSTAGRQLAERPGERRLRVAMLAPPWIPVPPPGYGGIEFVLTLLCDALVDQGHDVELLCAPGSRSKADVRPLLDAPHPESIERALFEADHVGATVDLLFERVADRSDSVALTDVRIDGQLHVVLEIQSEREPSPAGVARVAPPA